LEIAYFFLSKRDIHAWEGLQIFQNLYLKAITTPLHAYKAASIYKTKNFLVLSNYNMNHYDLYIIFEKIHFR
jgi:hypothetical protein